MALSARAIELAHQAIARRHPELPEQDVKLKFVELHYGADLAAKVREYLARRAR